jgi:hypothetical protein
MKILLMFAFAFVALFLFMEVSTPFLDLFVQPTGSPYRRLDAMEAGKIIVPVRTEVTEADPVWVD